MPHALPATRRRRLAIPTAALLALVLLAALAPTASGRPVRGGGGPVDPVQAHADRVAGLDRSGLQRAVLAAAGQRAVDGLDVPGAIPGELIVTTRDAGGLQRLQQTGWQSLGDTPLRAARGLADRVALVRTEASATADAARALLADPAVAAVEPNVRREYLATPDDTSYALQWAHRQTNAEQAWDTYTGQGATPPLIAILDSGVDATHPDLAPVVVASLRSAGGQVIPGAPDNDPCDIGHGTAVAGSAAARGDDGFGVTGALWQARVIDIALTSPENGCPGGPADSDTITAMAHVTNLPERPHALNLSLGASSPGCPASYQAAVDQARAAGIAVVAAAGNDGSTSPSIPASCAGAISVAATAVDGQLASYSQRNPQVDIAAPGGDFAGSVCPTTFGELVAQFVVTTARNAATASLGPVCGPYSDPNGHDLQGISGTSFSAPYVTAAIGLLRQLAADRGTPLSVDQVEAVIEGTARDAGSPGRDCEFGAGILDLGAAVAAVTSGAIPALQPDAPIGTGSCGGGGGGGDGGAEQLPPGVIRVSDGGAVTDPIAQAVAVSAGIIPPGQAPWAVLARVDDFADALAGSAVGFGIGPLLFTPSTGGLDPRTEAELTRAVEPGGQVFIMGGTAAVPAAVDERLGQLGLNPVRIAGGGREATAVAASEVVEVLVGQSGFATRDYAFVASGRAFADAVAAGQMAAYYGIPILVTNPEGPLHPDTRAELQRLQPSQVYVVGGAAAISDPVLAQIQQLGFPTARLAGPTRVDTGLEVGGAFVEELAGDGALQSAQTVAVNVRNNFNDVLSATFLGGLGNVFMPLEQDAAGSVVTDSVRQSGFCEFGGSLLVIGGRDRVSTASAVDANDILQGTAC